jgi:hypothetical protein
VPAGQKAPKPANATNGTDASAAKKGARRFLLAQGVPRELL